MFKKIILLLVLGLEIYRREFSAIGPRAEGTNFSGRLPFQVEGSFRRFKFFYGTTRKITEESFSSREAL